jgi:hypothetical protein
VTIAGQRAKLLDAYPCVWDGDSGCAGEHGLSHARSLCLAGAHRLALDTGANAAEVVVSVGRRGDAEGIFGGRPNGRVWLRAHRQDARRFTVDLPRRLSSDVRVMHVAVRYGGGVITPYRPYDASSSVGGDPAPFGRGVYGLRIRLRNC